MVSIPVLFTRKQYSICHKSGRDLKNRVYIEDIWLTLIEFCVWGTRSLNHQSNPRETGFGLTVDRWEIFDITCSISWTCNSYHERPTCVCADAYICMYNIVTISCRSKIAKVHASTVESISHYWTVNSTESIRDANDTFRNFATRAVPVLHAGRISTYMTTAGRQNFFRHRSVIFLYIPADPRSRNIFTFTRYLRGVRINGLRDDLPDRRHVKTCN